MKMSILETFTMIVEYITFVVLLLSIILCDSLYSPVRSSRISRTLSMKSHIDSFSIHVSNIPSSKAFYSNTFGAKTILESEGRATLSFSESADSIKLNLIEKKGYKRGSAFIGFGFQRPDALVCFSKASALGAKVLLPYDAYAYGASLVPDEDEMKQFPVTYGIISDPDGNSVEIIEGSRKNQFCKAILGVEDLNDTQKFFCENFKMTELRRRSNIMSKPRSASMVSYVGFGAEQDDEYLELKYLYSIHKVNVAEALDKISFSISKNVWNGLNSNVTEPSEVKDPNGYKVSIFQQ